MKLTVVGWSGSFPGPDSPASCYLLEHDDSRILLDLGNGALGALQRYADIYDVDAVFLSHLHVDHCIDLCSYYVARKYTRAVRRSASRCSAPAAPRIGWPPPMAFRSSRGCMTSSTSCATIRTPQWSARSPSRPRGWPTRSRPTASRSPRTGDPSCTPGTPGRLRRWWNWPRVRTSRCSKPPGGADNPTDLHLTGAQAADMATRAGAERLMLTHLVAWNDNEKVVAEAAEVYDGELLVGGSGLQVEV